MQMRWALPFMGEPTLSLMGELALSLTIAQHCKASGGELALPTVATAQLLSVDGFWHVYRRRKNHSPIEGWPLGI